MSNVYYFLGAGQPAFTTETQCGAWERQFAFGALEPTALVQHAKFDQLSNSYVRPNYTQVNAANINGNIVYSNTFANYNIDGRPHYFCDDTGFADKRGGFQEWTREARTLPQNHNTYEAYSYTFPGFYPFSGRDPYTDIPTSRLQRDFFLIGNVAEGANYADAGSIPQYRAQNYAWAYVFDYISTGNALINIGGMTIIDGYLANTNANTLVFASVPSLSNYQAWVQSDQNVSNTTWSIEAASSTLEQYAGPIWMRTRRFVKAQ